VKFLVKKEEVANLKLGGNGKGKGKEKGEFYVEKKKRGLRCRKVHPYEEKEAFSEKRKKGLSSEEENAHE